MHWKENGWDLPEKQSLWQRGPFFLPDQESESRFLSGSPAQKRPDRLTPHCFTTVSGNALHRAGQPASARSRGLLADIPRVWWRQRRLLCRAIKQKPRLRGVCIKKSKLTDKPGSVVDSHSSRPAIAHWLKQPTRVQYGPYLMNPYLALLRVEFTVPRTVTRRAVRSYRTLSPLPDPTCVGHRRFALCCTGRGLAPPRRYLAPCPMEPGLSSPPPVSFREGRRRSGDCLVSFGAHYRGFSPRCHARRAGNSTGSGLLLKRMFIERILFHTVYLSRERRRLFQRQFLLQQRQRAQCICG